MASRRYSQIDLLRSLACVMVLAFTICALGYGAGGVSVAPLHWNRLRIRLSGCEAVFCNQ